MDTHSTKFNEIQRYSMNIIHASLPGEMGYLFKSYLFTFFILSFSNLGRELSFILLFGLIWCYSMTFVLLAPPSTYICALQRFGVSDFTIERPSILLLFSPCSLPGLSRWPVGQQD